MSIQLFPYKLTHRELEARLEPGLTVLPGQLLRFDEQGDIYGQITEVWALEEVGGPSRTGQMIRLTLLKGMPSMQPTTISFLQPSQMANELARLLPKPEHPVVLEGFEGEYLRFGALTLLKGTDFVGKYHALLALMQAIRPYQKILVIDPLGVFETVGDLTCYVAGEQVRLGLQRVNGKRFLDVFGAQFPSGVRKPVMETVAAYWPEAGLFTGFSRLLTSGLITESLLKNLILQNCASVIHNKVFAEVPEQVLNLSRLAQNPISVLDVSALQDPWKGYFYQEVLAEVFANPALGLVPVLIYPENYLSDLGHWVQKADEYQVHLLGLTSPYATPAIYQFANNVVSVKPMGNWALQGDLTLGLPVIIGGEAELEVVPDLLPEATEIVETRPEVSAFPVSSSEQPVESPMGVYPPLPELFLENNIPEPEELEREEALTPNLQPMETESAALPEVASSSDKVGQTRFLNSWQQEELADSDLFAPPYVGEVAPSDEPEATDTEQPTAEEVAPHPVQPASPLFRTPVVDLSAPGVEAIPSFLSIEQLSALLNTPVTEDEESLELADFEPSAPTSTQEIEPVLQAAESTWTQEEVAFENEALSAESAEVADLLNYPDAEEGAISPEVGALPHFPEPDFAVPPEPPPEPELVETPASEPVFSPLPAFPEPEEFEREEFCFDLNLDQKTERLYEPVKQPAQAQSVLTDAVARSLSGFEQPETLPSNPVLEFDTEGVAQQLAQPAEVPIQETVPELVELPLPVENPQPEEAAIAVAKENTETAHAPSETDMQEALDLIFPRQFEAAPDSEPEETLAVETPPSVEVMKEEEPVPVIQKRPEPVPGGLPQFKAGDKVRHGSYGMGIVQKVIPMDNSVVLNITFENVGKRLLDPTLTELTLESAG